VYFQFAWRYFRSKKSTNAINIISWVSISAIAIGTAALLIILSVFNGFEGFIKDLYNSFYPEIKISTSTGKTFTTNYGIVKSLNELEGIRAVSYTLEEKVLLNHGEDQAIATIKGIDSNYTDVTQLDQSVTHGILNFNDKRANLVLGLGIANKLGTSEKSLLPVTSYAFRNSKGYNLNSISSFSQQDFAVQGVFYLQDEIDDKYAFAPLHIVQNLLGKENAYSSIEIALKPGANPERIKASLQTIVKDKNLKVETRYEQNKTLFMILNSERWAVYAILSLMLFIASFNIIGCLAMLILEKQKDIAILRTMGSDTSFIKKIFLSTSVLISLIGALIGSVIAILFAVLQGNFGFLKLGDDNFLVESYPVEMHWQDFVLIIFTVIVIALLAGYWPAKKASERPIELRVR
jgi:lipoprotein-releasing system permease protein